MTSLGTPVTPPAPQSSSGGAATATTVAPSAPGGASAAELYQELRAQRNVLGEQLRGLERTQDALVNDLWQGAPSDAARTGDEQRLAQVAAAAAVPGAVVEPPRPARSGPDPDIVAMGLVFTDSCSFP